METTKKNPIFLFTAIGSLIYALFYTLFLYKNTAGITFPFFVGGTCLFFFLYLKKSEVTAKKFSIFLTVSLILLGISTCLTDSWVLHLFNSAGILLLFFYLVLHNLYEDKTWDLPKYLISILDILCTSLIYIFKPFSDFSEYCKEKKERKNKPDGKGKYVFLGLIIAFPLIIMIIALLSSADAVFDNLFSILFSDFFAYLFEGNILGITFLFLFAFFASYCMISRITEHNLKEEISDKRTKEPIIGITFTSILSVIYLIFCLIQIIYLFGGLGSLPEGYSYATYAREGFFQLVFVCFLNLVLVLTCIKHFRSSKILKGLLTFISLCTYIMIASSTYRMLLYIDAYFLTFLRVFVLWALVVILLLMSGALVLIYKDNFPLFRYCAIVVSVLYVLFSFSRPDYWIAKYNIEQSYGSATRLRLENDHNPYTDYYYFSTLSLDAAPVIIDNAQNLGYSEEGWFLNYCAGIVQSGYYPAQPVSADINKVSIRKWNLSRWIAGELYTDYYENNPLFSKEIQAYIH